MELFRKIDNKTCESFVEMFSISILVVPTSFSFISMVTETSSCGSDTLAVSMTIFRTLLANVDVIDRPLRDMHQRMADMEIVGIPSKSGRSVAKIESGGQLETGFHPTCAYFYLQYDPKSASGIMTRFH